jgi:hypothetical protein
MPSQPFTYPPFGFSVWFDRHHGHGWCWREKRPRGVDTDETEGKNCGSKREAIRQCHAELKRRSRSDAPPSTPGSESA